jgi:ligand-binding SRPBCC domain-containing protein
MALITLKTEIKAPAERCFDLSLSVDIHVKSTARTGERAIAGVTSGLMMYGDTVTWRAKHLGVTQDLTSTISYYDRPRMFVSQMTKGAFKKLYHEHIFEARGPVTVMTDKFQIEAPFGILGRIFMVLFLKRYMQGFLEERNETIKDIAESEEWRRYLPVTV